MEAAGIRGFPSSLLHDSHFGWHSALIPSPQRYRRNRSIGSRTVPHTTAPSCRAGRSLFGPSRRCCPAGARPAARASAPAMRRSCVRCLARSVPDAAAPDPRLPDQPQNPARADDTGAAPFDTRASRRRSRRAATDPARRRAGRSHLAIDSTGLKVFGEGEWKIRLHGKDKRPAPRFLGPVAKPWLAWRKLHLAVDTTTGEILAHALTVNERHDGPELPRPAGQNQRAGVRPMPTRPMTRSPITRPFWREKKDR